MGLLIVAIICGLPLPMGYVEGPRLHNETAVLSNGNNTLIGWFDDNDEMYAITQDDFLGDFYVDIPINFETKKWSHDTYIEDGWICDRVTNKITKESYTVWYSTYGCNKIIRCDNMAKTSKSLWILKRVARSQMPLLLQSHPVA